MAMRSALLSAAVIFSAAWPALPVAWSVLRPTTWVCWQAVMNALALQDAFEYNDVPCRVMSAIQMNEICEPIYSPSRHQPPFQGGNVVIFAAGSGNPYFTTDTAAALRACEIGAEILIKATKVDGIYDKDPVKCADAVRFDKVTYHEVLVRGLQVMDSTATALCRITVCRFWSSTSMARTPSTRARG